MSVSLDTARQGAELAGKLFDLKEKRRRFKEEYVKLCLNPDAKERKKQQKKFLKGLSYEKCLLAYDAAILNLGKKSAPKINAPLIAMLVFAMLAISFIGSQMTGFLAGPTMQTVEQDVDIIFNESTTAKIGITGNILSLKVSGRYIGEGSA